MRERGELSLAQAVHKMTAQPAAVFGLVGRGRLEVGACADVVVFDPARIEDRATFERPHRYPVGLDHVFVNGTPVLDDGRPTGRRPGRPLRLRADRRVS